MKKKQKGFTLIEVSLFLVITGALFISIAVGVQNSIYQQRFNDAVQSFAEFLRTVYSEVTNVQNIGKGGTSEKAIYGKLVAFNVVNNTNDIRIYSVVGDVSDIGTGGALSALKDLKADIAFVDGDQIKTAGIIENYAPKWGAEIEPPCGDRECSYEPLTGALLIIRHPSSGTVYTYFAKGAKIEFDNLATPSTYQNILAKYINSFQPGQIDFCINPIGDAETNLRRDVRIASGARNSSAIEIVSDSNSKCSK